MPLTLPRQVSPAYGTVIESVPSVAVPVNEIAQEVSPGAVPFPWAFQLIWVGCVKAPSAVPASFSSPAQVALNEPFALMAVCSETFHLKSVHVLGVGMSDDEVQVPSIELLPAADGPVTPL